MSAREFVALGTASQVPTRVRNHHGALLRFDAEGLLFDPGEGTQQQLLRAGRSAADITRICITHLHGDHCLGLPGIVQRLGLDRQPEFDVTGPVDLYFPASGRPYIERLLTASLFQRTVEIRLHPIDGAGVADRWGDLTLEVEPLDHGPQTFGYRLREDDGRRMLPDRLAELGIAGPDVGRLQREGRLEVDGRTVTLEETSAPRRGQRVAFVMDTRRCDGARALAEGADLLVTESTFLDSDAALAESYGHLTARQAGELAAGGGARRLVLTHYSQRYTDEQEFAAEAGAVHHDVVAVRDLDRVPVPPRR
jgi:ribonuclease Z